MDLSRTRVDTDRAIVRPAFKTHSNQWKGLSVCLVVCDAFMLYLALRLSYLIRFSVSLPIFQLNVVPLESTYTIITIVLVPITLSIYALVGLYSRRNLLSGTREATLLLNASTVVVFLVMASDFLVPGWPVARGWLLLNWLVILLLMVAERYTIRRLVRRLRKAGWFLSPAIIIGANEEGRLLAEQFSQREYSGLYIVGFIDESLPKGSSVFGKLKNLGSIAAIEGLIKKYKVEELILASSAISQSQLITIFQKFGLSHQLNLRMSSGLYQIIATGCDISEIANVPLIGVQRLRLTGIDLVGKLLLDYGLAIPITILISPLLALLAILIKLDSPGPIFYRRRVMGVDGKQFDAFKFRTMVKDADKFITLDPCLKQEFEKNHKLKVDPRVTRLGKILRKWSLDELPQLINVIRNEMSIVGPRMICPDEMQKYREAGINLLTVKPGITGLWQVSGRSNVSYDERVQMDMYYIRNWNLMLDIYLLFRTIPAVLRRDGAY